MTNCMERHSPVRKDGRMWRRRADSAFSLQRLFLEESKGSLIRQPFSSMDAVSSFVLDMPKSD
jgi:hypothetical protein